ncbi:MAG: HhH-GPD-type base excision DNA repair protein [Acidimicrobiales bacterium]|nr:HhH-GPD-type base excision DNA repair protein [Acidimicrobiales bacterium]
MPGTLVVTGDPTADHLVNTDPLALMIAMLLDQQIAIELAFMGPARLAERLGGELDAGSIAAMDPDTFAEIARTKPALHRFPAAMGGRIQEMCRHIVDTYDGDAGAIWRRVRRAEVLESRLLAVPGFGPEKVRILTAVLAKRFGRRPAGWQAVAGAFADDELRSVADLDSTEALAALRAKRRAMKEAGKTKTD